MSSNQAQVNYRWGLQWSRAYELWHCEYCNAYSRGRNHDILRHVCKNKPEEVTTHIGLKEVANLLVHEKDCPWYQVWKKIQDGIKRLDDAHYPKEDHGILEVDLPF